MALSYNISVASGATNVFGVTFPFLERSHVHVYVDGVEVDQGDLTWVTDATIQLPEAAADYTGQTILRQRETPASEPITTYAPGTLDEDDLNNSFLQLLYYAQEQDDLNGISIRLAPGDDTGASMVLPEKAERLGKLIAFDEATGAAGVTGFTAEQVQSVIDAALNVDPTGLALTTSYTPRGTGATAWSVQARLQEDAPHLFDFVDPSKHAGIIAGTNTDDLTTALYNLMFEASGQRALLPRGVIHCNVTSPSGTPFNLQGSGATGYGTILEPHADHLADRPVFRNIHYSHEGRMNRLADILFRASSAGVGIGYQAGADAYTVNHELIGYVDFERVVFKDFDKCWYAPWGSIGNMFRGFLIQGSPNYGFRATGSNNALNPGSTTQHTGANQWMGGKISGCEKAGMLLDNPGDGAGQWDLRFVKVEQNPGCGIVLISESNVYQPGLNMDTVWLEGNCKTGGVVNTVTLDVLGSESASDLILDGISKAHLHHVAVQRVDLRNFSVLAAVGSEGLYAAGADAVNIQHDGTSYFSWNGLQSQFHKDQVNLALGPVGLNTGTAPGGNSPTARTPPRNNALMSMGGGTFLSEVTGKHAPSVNVTGTSTVACPLVRDGMGYPGAYEFVIPGAGTWYMDSPWTPAADSFVVTTWKARKTSGTAPNMQAVFTEAYTGEVSISSSEWRQFISLCRADSSPANARMTITATAGGTIRWQDYRVLSFSTLKEALDWINSGAYADFDPVNVHGTAAPTGGSWFRGDKQWQDLPVVGGPAGRVVTADGTPGTWTPFGYSFIEGSATYDPPNLVDGAGATTTVTATGAALGDFAQASFSLDLQGIIMFAWVSSANTVSVRFQNESGGAVDLGSGTLRVRVQKQT